MTAWLVNTYCTVRKSVGAPGVFPVDAKSCRNLAGPFLIGS